MRQFTHWLNPDETVFMVQEGRFITNFEWLRREQDRLGKKYFLRDDNVTGRLSLWTTEARQPTTQERDWEVLRSARACR